MIYEFLKRQLTLLYKLLSLYWILVDSLNAGLLEAAAFVFLREHMDEECDDRLLRLEVFESNVDEINGLGLLKFELKLSYFFISATVGLLERIA